MVGLWGSKSRDAVLSSRPVSPQITRLCIHDVRLVDPASDRDEVLDIWVESGVITALGKGAMAAKTKTASDRVIDGHQLVLTPGLWELHAQLGEPGLEYREDLASGLAAAAAGGFTHVCSRPDTSPVNDRRAITEALLAKAGELAQARLMPIAAATDGLSGKQLAEVGDLLDAGAVAVSNGPHSIPEASLMRRLLQYCHSFDALMMQCPQDPSLSAGGLMHEGAVSTRMGLRGWPAQAEEIALGRDLVLAKLCDARYHATSLSCAQSVDLLRRAKNDGVKVSADVSAHHLTFTDENLGEYDPRFLVEPPLRSAADRQALLTALAEGVIDCVSSDHNPQTALDTECELELSAPGISGLQTCLSALWQFVASGQLEARRAVAALTTGPAKVLGSSAPSLRVDELADFALFSPDRTWQVSPNALRSRGKNTPWLNRQMTGQVLMTAASGRLTLDILNDQDVS